MLFTRNFPSRRLTTSAAAIAAFISSLAAFAAPASAQQLFADEFNTTTIVITHDMNSMMEIGEQITFLYEGHKLWEGDNNSITSSSVAELNEFIYANKLLRDMGK